MIRHLLVSLVTFTLVSGPSAPAQTPAPVPASTDFRAQSFDVTSIKQVVLDYQVAFLTGDTVALKKTVTEGFLNKVGGETLFFAKVSRLRAEKPYTASGANAPATTTPALVTVREVSKDAAVAGFRENESSPWGFFRLKKDPAHGWRIDAPVESH